MAGDKLEEALGNDPWYMKLILALLKASFFIYDVIVYVPFQLFANPEDKIARSKRRKGVPMVECDPSSPWVHVDTKEGGSLLTTPLPGCNTLSEVWNEAVRRYEDGPCMGTREVLKISKEKQKNGKIFEKWEMGRYHWRSFNQVDARTNLVASGLLSLGQKVRDPVVMFAETREEWMTTAIACFKGGFPVATVYATLGEEAVEYALNEVGATTIFTTEALLPVVHKAHKNGAKIRHVIYFESVDPESQLNSTSFAHDDDYEEISFSELLNRGDENFEFKADHKIEPNDLAMIMYTSGTTGNPKGVMISHKNIVTASAGQGAVITVNENDTYIGYLPLAHILEVAAEVVCFTKGTRIGYSSAQTLFDRAPKIARGTKGDTTELRPTLMACVPAVMDRIYKAVIDDVNTRGACFKEMFRCFYDRKKSRYEDGYKSFLLNKLVFNKIGKLLGGKLRMVLSGGAPLSAETQRFMNICFCCPVIQGYGLTETCGGGTIADLDDLSTGTVGPPLRCAEILLEAWEEAGYAPTNERPQGEILIGGEHVALGYYKNPEKTKEDFVTRNGKRYFATGDIGEFRKDGSLKIIDRKKDLLKLSHGEYISLGKVETNLLTNPNIDNICVVGDSDRDFLVALVVPNQKNVTALAEKAGVDVSNWEKVCVNKEVVQTVLADLQNYVKGKLQRVEIPKKIHLCSDPWTPTSGLLTEALKLKRKNIEKEFAEEIKFMYR